VTPDELMKRAMEFGIRVLPLVDSLPNTRAGHTIGRQLASSALSIAANYRAARRARSRKEFRAKLCIVVEEADETDHWLQVVTTAGMIDAQRLTELRAEALELLKIFSRMRKTAFED